MYPVGWPFGGYKQSGLGRENGAVTLNNFTQLYNDLRNYPTPVSAVFEHITARVV